MLGWFRALMPREERFFELFTRHAQVTVAGAVVLRDVLKGRKDVAQGCKEISQREAEADELTREVLIALRRTFITPLDRGDIKDLITSMDDAIDQMNQTAKVITLFELRAFERPMQDMGRKWALSKLAPRKYGDRVEHDHKGGLNFQPAVLVQIGGNERVDDELERNSVKLVENGKY